VTNNTAITVPKVTTAESTDSKSSGGAAAAAIIIVLLFLLGLPIVFLFVVPRCCPNSNLAQKVNNFKQTVSKKIDKIRKEREIAKKAQLSIIESKRVETNQSKRFLQTDSMHEGSSSAIGLYSNNAPI
jgi:predicted PurR-regulated permease PerM